MKPSSTAHRPSRRAHRPSRWLLPALPLLATLAPSACVDKVTLSAEEAPGELAVNESRTVELRYLRFDVKKFEQTLTMSDLRKMPQKTLDEMWLLDLDLSSFLQSSLTQIIEITPEDAYALPRPARNLWRLLNMTADNAVLDGTSLAELIGIGKAVGLPPSLILADLVGLDPNVPVIPTTLTTEAVLKDVVGSHPSAQTRRGRMTPEHPDGVYPVKPGSLPVSLADVVDNFSTLAARFGPAPADPADPNGPRHPGFIKSSSGIVAAEEGFAMTVQVNLDALPFKGLDMTRATPADVNSTGSQVDHMFDFDNPDWLRLKGLARDLSIGELTMSIYEDDAFVPGGTSREPLPTGNSPVWDLPPWDFEHLIMDVAHRKAAEVAPHCTSYGPEGDVDPPFSAVNVCIDETGWTELSIDPGVILESPPPEPSYFWDVLSEVAQARLHDGGLAEGDGDIEITLHDVPVGISTDDLVEQIKANVEADPAALTDVAERLNDNASGDADFYYVADGEAGGDYLYFVAPSDLRKDEDGKPVREYAYPSPGFFADEALAHKVSSTDALGADTLHEKVAIKPGTVVYMKDDAARLYAIHVGDKPSAHSVSLTLTRIQ